MYKIGKEFSFCYGHRVHNQQLNSELSLDSCLACRHQHGHQGTIIVYLEANELSNGMVTDFKHLNWFKKWLDDVLDHKMILDFDDPSLSIFYPLLNRITERSFSMLDKLTGFPEGHHVISPENYLDLSDCEREIYEGLVLVPFVPTSENLSKWLFDIIQKKMGHICKVHSVQFFETPKSQSNYFAE